MARASMKMNECEGKYIQRNRTNTQRDRVKKERESEREKMTEYFDGVCIESNWTWKWIQNDQQKFVNNIYIDKSLSDDCTHEFFFINHKSIGEEEKNLLVDYKNKKNQLK
jgi:hypothetical protein